MTPEGKVKRAILDALQAAGAFAFPVQAGKVKVRGGWMQLAPPGTPDILVVVPPDGHLLGLEVKTAKTKERLSQLAWAEGAREAGVTVRTVRTVAEAVGAYLETKARPEATSRKQTRVMVDTLED